MSKFDISGWKEYKIIDLFDVKNTHSILATSVIPDSGSTPYLTASESNNAIATFIEYDKTLLDKGNCIFIGGKTLVITYQDKDFYSNDSHNLALYIKDERGKSKNAQLFMVAALYKCLKPLYFWGDSISRKSIQNDYVRLPAMPQSGEPDYSYMEKCVEQEVAKVRLALAELKSAKARRKKISCLNWREFHLYDLFEIDMGTKLDKIKMDTSVPEINFVGRANEDNGVTAKIKKIPGLEPYKAGDITLALGGAYLGSCFIQRESFYTSQNVNVLKEKHPISYNAKFFICAVIFKESQLHYKAFIDELNRHIKTDFTIKLPVDSSGNPDFAFMENYVRKMLAKQQKGLKAMYVVA